MTFGQSRGHGSPQLVPRSLVCIHPSRVDQEAYHVVQEAADRAVPPQVRCNNPRVHGDTRDPKAAVELLCHEHVGELTLAVSRAVGVVRAFAAPVLVAHAFGVALGLHSTRHADDARLRADGLALDELLYKQLVRKVVDLDVQLKPILHSQACGNRIGAKRRENERTCSYAECTADC